MVDGMPRAPYHKESRVEKYAASIADVKRELSELEKEILLEECALQRYISTVPDSRMRLILQYRFVDGLEWRDVARRMDNGNTTTDSVKMAVSRFLKGEESSAPTQSAGAYKVNEKEK